MQRTSALLSPECRFLEAEGNLARFETLIDRAAGRGARRVCFPELALTGYPHHLSVMLRRVDPARSKETETTDAALTVTRASATGTPSRVAPSMA